MYQHTAESQQVSFNPSICVDNADEDPGPITPILAFIIGLFLLIAATMTLASHQVQATAATPIVSKAPFSNSQIARAALATVSGQPLLDIAVVRQENGVVYTAESNKSTQPGWKSRCKVEGNRIVLATATGRWKTDLQNEKVTFAVKGENLAVACLRSDGSLTERNFTLQELTI